MEITFYLRNLSKTEIIEAIKARKIVVEETVLLDDVIQEWDIPGEVLLYFSWRVAQRLMDTCGEILECHAPELNERLRELMNLHCGILDKFDAFQHNGHMVLANTDEPGIMPDVAGVAEAWGIAYAAFQTSLWPTIKEEAASFANDPVLHYVAECVLAATGTRPVSNPASVACDVMGKYYCAVVEYEQHQYDDPPNDLEETVCKREEAWLAGLLIELLEKLVPDGYTRSPKRRKNY